MLPQENSMFGVRALDVVHGQHYNLPHYNVKSLITLVSN